MSEERLRERTVPTGLPIEGGAFRIAGEGDQRPAGEVAIDAAQSALDDERSRLVLGEHRGKGIVPAGVEDDDVDAIVALHLLEQ